MHCICLMLGSLYLKISVYCTHLPKILLTHPLETWRIRDISHGRAPEWASSTIFCRVESGNGLPPTKTPPSWLTPLWPEKFHICFPFIFFSMWITTNYFKYISVHFIGHQLKLSKILSYENWASVCVRISMVLKDPITPIL